MKKILSLLLILASLRGYCQLTPFSSLPTVSAGTTPDSIKFVAIMKSGAGWTNRMVYGIDIFSSRAPLVHTHTLSQLLQSGATTGQVPQWNGSAWVPTTPAAGGGSPANLSLGSATNATQPVNNSNGTGVVLPIVTSTTAGLLPAWFNDPLYKTYTLRNSLATLGDSILRQNSDSVMLGKKLYLHSTDNTVTITKAHAANDSLLDYNFQVAAAGNTISVQQAGVAQGSFSTINFNTNTTGVPSGSVYTVNATGGGGGGTTYGNILDWQAYSGTSRIIIDLHLAYLTYKHILIEVVNFLPVNATNAYIRVSTDGSTFQTTNYLSYYSQGASIQAGPTNAFQMADQLSNLSGETMKGSIEIFYPGTLVKPSVKWNMSGFYGIGSNNSPNFFGSGSYNVAPTDAASTVKYLSLEMNSGNITSASIRITGF